MGRLIIITTPDLVPGFQLAGVEVYAAGSAGTAQTLLGQFLDKQEAGLIAVRQELLEGMAPRLQRRVETCLAPMVIGIPGGTPGPSQERHWRQVSDLIRRVVGFQITLGTDTERSPSN